MLEQFHVRSNFWSVEGPACSTSIFPLLANSHTTHQIIPIECEIVYPFHFAKPALGLLATWDRFVFPIFEDQCSLPKRKRKRKEEKEKEKKKKKNKSREALP